MLLDMQDSVTGGLQRFTVGAPTENIACLEDGLFSKLLMFQKCLLATGEPTVITVSLVANTSG